MPIAYLYSETATTVLVILAVHLRDDISCAPFN